MTIFREVAEGESSEATTLNLKFHGSWKLFASVICLLIFEKIFCICLYFKFGRKLEVFIIYLTICVTVLCSMLIVIETYFHTYRNYMKMSTSLIWFFEFLFKVIYIVSNSGWANFTSGTFEKHQSNTTLKKWNSQVEGNLILHDILLFLKFDLELPN